MESEELCLNISDCKQPLLNMLTSPLKENSNYQVCFFFFRHFWPLSVNNGHTFIRLCTSHSSLLSLLYPNNFLANIVSHFKHGTLMESFFHSLGIRTLSSFRIRTHLRNSMGNESANLKLSNAKFLSEGALEVRNVPPPTHTHTHVL